MSVTNYPNCVVCCGSTPGVCDCEQCGGLSAPARWSAFVGEITVGAGTSCPCNTWNTGPFMLRYFSACEWTWPTTIIVTEPNIVLFDNGTAWEIQISLPAAYMGGGCECGSSLLSYLCDYETFNCVGGNQFTWDVSSEGPGGPCCEGTSVTIVPQGLFGEPCPVCCPGVAIADTLFFSLDFGAVGPPPEPCPGGMAEGAYPCVWDDVADKWIYDNEVDTRMEIWCDLDEEDNPIWYWAITFGAEFATDAWTAATCEPFGLQYDTGVFGPWCPDQGVLMTVTE